MRSEFNGTDEGPQPGRTLSTEAEVEGGTGALEALDRFFGSGKGTGPQDPVASDGPGREAPPQAAKPDAAGQEGDQGDPPIPKQATGTNPSAGIDDRAGAVAGHGGDDRSSAGGEGDTEDRGSGGSGSQLEVVHPDDPGFLEEFGAFKDGEQGIFDWFALETKDPLDVEDDMFSEAADLPGKLAERESGKHGSAVGAADRRGNPAEAKGQRSLPDPSGPEAVRRGGLNGSRSPGETDGTVVDSAGAAIGSGSKAKPSGATPQDRSTVDRTSGKASGGAPWLRKLSAGWPRRGLAVVALAAVGGVGMMQLTGDAGFRRTLESAVFGSTGSEFGDASAPLPGDILSNLSLADSESPSNDAGSIVRVTGRMGDAVQLLEERTVPGNAGRFRLQLVPVDLNAAGPLTADAPETVEWDRLFSLLGKPVGTLSAKLGTGTGPIGADQPEARPETVGPSGSVRPSVEFTADDGFGFAATEAFDQSVPPVCNVDYLGADLPPVGVADEAEMPANPAAELEAVVTAVDRQAGAATGFMELEERVAGIVGRLEALDRNLDELRAQIGSVILRRTGAPSLSPFVAPEGFAQGLKPDAENREAVYVIRSGKDEPAPIAALAEVKIGDRVDGFGKVLDIVEYGDRGRLLVMEEGSVYLN